MNLIQYGENKTNLKFGEQTKKKTNTTEFSQSDDVLKYRNK